MALYGIMAVMMALAGIIAFALLAYVVGSYNLFISRRNRVDNAFSSVDIQLKKRYDLIPNIQAAVKGYMGHEQETLVKITEIRASVVSGKDSSPKEKFNMDNQLSGLMKSLFMVAENYPELKASDNFMHLQRTLTEIEEQISAARRTYNAAVLDFNNACDMFPTNIVAAVFKFHRRDFFEAVASEKENVELGDFKG